MRPVIWTPDMLATLRQLRDDGTPILACAQRLGVYYNGTNQKCRELGIAGRRSRGRTPGIAAVSRRRRAV